MPVSETLAAALTVVMQAQVTMQEIRRVRCRSA